MPAEPPTDVTEPLPESPGSIAERAYAIWLAEADDPGARQQPVQIELIAEHYLMGGVLLAMDKELRRIDQGHSLRTAFWARTVEFNGDFVHACHRVKEEELLIPALIANGIKSTQYVDSVHREHERAKRLTLGIRDGVEEGDWEKVMRLVAMYVSFLRPHMQHEELELFGEPSEKLPPAIQAELRAGFTEAETKAMKGNGRRHFVDLAGELIRLVELDYAL